MLIGAPKLVLRLLARGSSRTRRRANVGGFTGGLWEMT